ncbi:MAG: hypothetical protein JST29_06430 [Bacteroidetes bacterium]|nr:hypothetical protein [Bacteroidota bacterium]
MKKKFAHLGRVLTREEAKLIVGGTAPVDGGDVWGTCTCVNGSTGTMSCSDCNNWCTTHKSSKEDSCK